MFRSALQSSPVLRLLGIAGIVYVDTVRKIRRSHGNPLAGLLYGIAQAVMLVAVFWLMFAVLGLRGNAVRGDFLLYIMSGIFLFLTFNKAMTSVVGAENATSAIMLHAPMHPIIAIVSSALSALFMQVLSLAAVLWVYHLGWGPITVHQPLAAFSMLLLAWFSGASVGVIFLALKPWAPALVNLVVQLYSRANMVASGKMFLANTVPATMRVWFDWNPLFHTIDQARGFTFINYNPHFSSVAYPLTVSLALLSAGLLLEFATRRQASLSWAAGR